MCSCKIFISSFGCDSLRAVVRVMRVVLWTELMIFMQDRFSTLSYIPDPFALYILKMFFLKD